MADAQNPKSLNDQGDACFYGIGRPINRELAYTFYRQAADMDNPVGYHNLGNYFAAKGDLRSAIQNYEKAKAFLHAPAFLALARLYTDGAGVRHNRTKAFRMMLGAAKLADIDAYVAVGFAYRDGIGTKKDVLKAEEWFRKAADQNDARGACQLGLLLMAGKAFAKDPDEAFGWLDKAAAGGSLEAMKTLRDAYAAGRHPVLRKKSRRFLDELAFRYAEMLAQAGDPDSLRQVADVYRDGSETVRADAEKAAEYYRMLLAQGDVAGKAGYGTALLYGRGVSADVPKALELLAAAARDGHAGAMTRLGDAARTGLGTPVDYEAAKKWYLEAARLEDAEAMMNLGLLNYRSQIEGASPQLAFTFMETAAKAAFAQAYYWLGIFYDKGVGCPADFEAAEKAFEKAIERGSVGASYKLAAMLFESLPARHLKPKRLEEGWKRCRERFIAYLEDPSHNAANGAFAMYDLGVIFRDGLGTEASPRRARYWFEAAATAGLSRAMVEMYRILREREFDAAREWLDRALLDRDNADALYEKGILLEKGAPGFAADPKQARSLLEAAARLDHKGAIARIMLN